MNGLHHDPAEVAGGLCIAVPAAAIVSKDDLENDTVGTLGNSPHLRAILSVRTVSGQNAE